MAAFERVRFAVAGLWVEGLLDCMSWRFDEPRKGPEREAGHCFGSSSQIHASMVTYTTKFTNLTKKATLTKEPRDRLHDGSFLYCA